MTPAPVPITGTPAPVSVSIIVPNFNGAAFLRQAITSACRQSLRDIEIIVSDDASTDNSLEIVTQLMQQDARIRLLKGDCNRGPATARNRALACAVGDWIAVLDNDDLMHPERLLTLVRAAERDGADIVADDLLLFDSNRIEAPRPLLRGSWLRSPFWVDIASYVRTNALFGRGPALGYLKPIFRASFLKKLDASYDERLRVAEDFDFVLRLLQAGARFRVYPILMYFYRRHGASISHRLTTETIQAMQLVDRETRARLGSSQTLKRALNARTRSLDTALSYVRLVDALKSRDLIAAIRIAMGRPQALRLLWEPIVARLKKRRRATSSAAAGFRKQVCVLARQRLVGPTNGSSIYLLGLVRALVDSGVDVHFLSPSPTTLGRWPYLRLGKELNVFRTVRVRGTWRIGRFLVANNPRILLQGLLATIEVALLRVGIISRPVLKPAPYAIACPLTRADELFVARHATTVGDALVADYCFLTEAFPYTLRPEAKTAVIMHDMFSSRAAQFSALNKSDSAAALTEAAECALLGNADVVVAIQKDEADFLRSRIPHRRIIVAPMAVVPAETPKPGEGDQILFVGSAAAANVDGLNWFIECCWPKIRARRPSLILRVAGTVCQKIAKPPRGIELLGLVEDLAPLYSNAALVISPLRAGSGLKIKLIEALGQGKAVVATSVTLQGVSDILRDCVWVADDADEFASAVIRLAGDKPARSALAARGLAAVRQNFSPQTCYGEFVHAVTAEGVQ
jgi:glycosyltransferase involved in cell wall biosynthesis